MKYHIVQYNGKFYMVLLRNGVYERCVINSTLEFNSLKDIIKELCNTPQIHFHNDYFQWKSINYDFEENIVLNSLSKDYLVQTFPEFFVF